MADKKGSNSEKLLYCSFCGKSQHEVKKLIAGPSVFICDECIDLCNEIIRDEAAGAGTDAGLSKSDLPSPQEIRDILDQYVIGQERAKKILAVAGLTRRGELVEATAAIQRALAGALPTDKPMGAHTSRFAPSADVLDDCVRELDVIPVDTKPGVWDVEAAVEVDDLPLDAPPPETDRPRTGRFSASTFTAEAGTRSFKLFEPASRRSRRARSPRRPS